MTGSFPMESPGSVGPSVKTFNVNGTKTGRTFIQDGAEDSGTGRGGAVPSLVFELVVTLQYAELSPQGHTGHRLGVLLAYAELLIHQARHQVTHVRAGVVSQTDR